MQRLTGLALLGIGLAAALFFVLVFDATVASEAGGRVYNMGKMNDQQNGLVFSATVAIVGAVLFGTGRPESPS